ncbi:class I SAM-dependent methyltransferase [Trichlorobacter ammonificans]|uniref:Methyltransferase type 11 n=1 Tax=Trichlorobacter ammonificans TaxID=2916410 RepID=A0ABM9D687_9BACT|nr:class I SAM-dependent methyltransferase [Trichlorobacter ammonificans]CAH2029892.1 Methyltransferase type 11 [Trichlorobacter ammonificans]
MTPASRGFTDHFAQVADHYAAHRPTYPPALFDWLSGQVPVRDLAWDCATGTGQAAGELARRFNRVVATDASSGQIAAATPCAGVEYRAAPAEQSGLEAGSVDLITVAQALHWFDLDRFYAEVRRVLKPGGLLAVWTYGVFGTEGGEDTAAVQQMLHTFYYETVGPYWPPQRRHVENGYADLAFPFAPVTVPAFSMAVAWRLADLAGYLRSWSATARYRELHGSDPVEALERELRPLWGAGRRQVVWPLAIRAGRLS